MSSNNTIQKLKNLKQIKPDENFVQSTRGLILNERPQTTESVGLNLIPKWGFALGVALILLIATGSIYLTPDKPSMASSLDSNELQNELEALTIQVEEVGYSQETNQAIASALDEISTSQASHLNKSILEREQNGIEELQGSEKSENINQMLDKVIF